MKKYTIKELNTYSYTKTQENLVVHVKNEEEWDTLKTICPKMTEYYEDRNYYLTAAPGYSDSPYYITIEFDQIDFNSEKKLIGYNLKEEVNEAVVRAALNYKIKCTPFLGKDNIVYLYDNKAKELNIQDWFEPVYDESPSSTHIEIGEQKRNTEVFKEYVLVTCGDGVRREFYNPEIERINKLFKKQMLTYDVKVTKLQIGCKDGVELSEEDIILIRNTQNELK